MCDTSPFGLSKCNECSMTFFSIWNLSLVSLSLQSMLRVNEVCVVPWWSICLSFPPIHCHSKQLHSAFIYPYIHTSIYLSNTCSYSFAKKVVEIRLVFCDAEHHPVMFPQTSLVGLSFLPSFRLCSYPCLRFYSWWHVLTVCPVLCLLPRLLQLHLYIPMKSSWESGECQPDNVILVFFVSLTCHIGIITNVCCYKRTFLSCTWASPWAA